jgi:hypothetical protein
MPGQEKGTRSYPKKRQKESCELNGQRNQVIKNQELAAVNIVSRFEVCFDLSGKAEKIRIKLKILLTFSSIRV